MPRGCGPDASHTRSKANLSCLSILTFKLSPTGVQQLSAVLEPAIRQMTDTGDAAPPIRRAITVAFPTQLLAFNDFPPGGGSTPSPGCQNV